MKPPIEVPRELTPAEKALIEKQLIARQAAEARRRHRMETVFLLGMIAASVGAAGHALLGRGVVTSCLTFAWLFCCALYTGFAIVPLSFDKDVDPRWHLNPWQEALERLGKEGRQMEGIVLLCSFPILRVVLTMVVGVMAGR